MTKFKVRVWYAMEAEIDIDAEDETQADEKARAMANDLDYQDVGDLYVIVDEGEDDATEEE